MYVITLIRVISSIIPLRTRKYIPTSVILVHYFQPSKKMSTATKTGVQASNYNTFIFLVLGSVSLKYLKFFVISISIDRFQKPVSSYVFADIAICIFKAKKPSPFRNLTGLKDYNFQYLWQIYDYEPFSANNSKFAECISAWVVDMYGANETTSCAILLFKFYANCKISHYTLRLLGCSGAFDSLQV